MTRINVTEDFRLTHTNSSFKMEFMGKVDTSKALEAMMEAVTEINYANGYTALWLQDISDSLTDSGFEFDSTLFFDEFEQYIPSMLKAVAKALPHSTFKGYAAYDSVQCFCVSEYEFSYEGLRLNIKNTFMDDTMGYFCPECGAQVALPDEEFDSDEIECEDCEKALKVTDLKYVPPVEKEETFNY